MRSRLLSFGLEVGWFMWCLHSGNFSAIIFFAFRCIAAHMQDTFNILEVKKNIALGNWFGGLELGVYSSAPSLPFPPAAFAARCCHWWCSLRHLKILELGCRMMLVRDERILKNWIQSIDGTGAKNLKYTYIYVHIYIYICTKHGYDRAKQK